MMRDRTHLQLELMEDSATLYVHRRLDHERCASLVAMCVALPAHVRTLRLDVSAAGAMTGDAIIGAVRAVLAQWRATREGEFILSTSHLSATCGPARRVESAVAELPGAGAGMQGAAMTAAFL
jgi:hypothetical protein